MAERILIVYYSRSGNTRKIANLIQQDVGGTMHEIRPVAPYPDSYKLCPRSTILSSLEIVTTQPARSIAKPRKSLKTA